MAVLTIGLDGTRTVRELTPEEEAERAAAAAAAEAQANSEPNWVGFNSTFLADANWIATASQFSTPDIRTGIVSAAATANANALQTAYGLAVADLTAQSVTLDQAVLDGWQGIADANNIAIDFTI